jgi:DNA-binding response OmpR family regulator
LSPHEEKTLGLCDKSVESKMAMSSKLILIVARDKQVLDLISAVLQRASFRTLTATLAQEALDRFHDEIDLVLTDCNLPDFSGEELAFRLLKLKTNLPICFMSGGLPSSLNTILRLEPGVNFIQKPFGMPELLEFVNSALRP